MCGFLFPPHQVLSGNGRVLSSSDLGEEWWRLEVKKKKKINPELREPKTKSHKMFASLNSIFARWRLWTVSRIWTTWSNIQELAESRNAIPLLRNEWMNHEWMNNPPALWNTSPRCRSQPAYSTDLFYRHCSLPEANFFSFLNYILGTQVK